jgi:hypothetical protein
MRDTNYWRASSGRHVDVSHHAGVLLHGRGRRQLFPRLPSGARNMGYWGWASFSIVFSSVLASIKHTHDISVHVLMFMPVVIYACPCPSVYVSCVCLSVSVQPRVGHGQSRFDVCDICTPTQHTRARILHMHAWVCVSLILYIWCTYAEYRWSMHHIIWQQYGA